MSLFDSMKKMKEMKQKMDEIKTRLDTVYVSGEAANGKVKVVVSANRQVKEVQLDDSLMTSGKEELQNLLTLAMNNALTDAEKVFEAEMKGAASGMMPNIPGLF